MYKLGWDLLFWPSDVGQEIPFGLLKNQAGGLCHLNTGQSGIWSEICAAYSSIGDIFLPSLHLILTKYFFLMGCWKHHENIDDQPDG